MVVNQWLKHLMGEKAIFRPLKPLSQERNNLVWRKLLTPVKPRPKYAYEQKKRGGARVSRVNPILPSFHPFISDIKLFGLGIAANDHIIRYLRLKYKHREYPNGLKHLFEFMYKYLIYNRSLTISEGCTTLSKPIKNFVRFAEVYGFLDRVAGNTSPAYWKIKWKPTPKAQNLFDEYLQLLDAELKIILSTHIQHIGK